MGPRCSVCRCSPGRRGLVPRRVNAHVSGNCDDLGKRASEAQAKASQPQSAPAPLELAPDSDTTIDFRLRRSARTTSVFLQRVRSADTTVDQTTADEPATLEAPPLPEPGSQLKVEAVDFEREGGDFELGAKHISAVATVRNNREGVRLQVCIDPRTFRRASTREALSSTTPGSVPAPSSGR